MQKQEISKISETEAQLPKQLLQIYINLYVNPQTGKQSALHRQKHIIINPNNNLGRFLEGEYVNGLKRQQLSLYYKTKSHSISLLVQLCEQFKLNTKFLKQTNISHYKSLESLKDKSNNKQPESMQKNHENHVPRCQKNQTPFVVYLINEIYRTFQKSEASQQSQLYRQNLAKLYYLIVNLNSIPLTHLQYITQLLSDKYYQKSLSLQLIQTSFRLVEAGIQERNIYPYLYFIQNSAINAIKILYNSPKWIFSKGMTVWTWFQAQNVLSDENKKQNCNLFLLKTDQGNIVKVKLLSNLDLEISSYVGGKQVQIAKITELQHKIKFNEITMMGIQLELLEGGFLKSNNYSLNMRINSSFYKETIISTEKMPKFSSNDLITDFVLFDKFIGKVYSIIISNKNQLNAYQKLSTSFSNYGICNQSQVWTLIQSNILKKQNIVGIFNTERSFEGILINYVGQKNLACFSGLACKEKYNKYDYQIIDVLMPYLYFLIVTKKTQINQQSLQCKKQQEYFQNLFDMIIKQIIKIVAGQEKDQDFIPSQDILFILYFLELSSYAISQSTLNYLLDEVKNTVQTQNMYFELIGQFLDIALLVQRGLHIQNWQAQLQDMNPVRKTQILFLLESKWQKKWTTQFQGFPSWWSPTSFKYQNDKEFSPQVYGFDQKSNSYVEWEVRNFITNDFCKCILMPVFKIPQYANLKKYQQQYVGKQCMLQQFSLQLSNMKKGSKVILKKYAASTLDKMKKKLLGSKQSKQKQPTPGQKLITLGKKVSIKNQILTECIFIDLLSVIGSTVKISKQGFIVISSKHSSKQFDHMCVKAFANEQFLYFTFHLRQIIYIRKRRFNQSMNTLQIRLKSGQIYLLYFHLKNIDQFIQVLQEHVQTKKDPYASYLESQQPFKWIDKQMSNFQYIQWLNDVAGRNFLDIAQYPVLPWVFVADTEQEKKQQKIYRDLMKNMGSHGSADRIQHFLQKYSSNNEQQLFNEYHFGTHYSSSAIIFNYLIRVRPFSIGALTLQSGKFDCADRVFWSYVGSWNNATNSPTDIRELIPEVYTLPQMFLNVNNYDFGLTQDKSRIDNVQLPKWCQGNPYRFIARIRKQLQSVYVSENINHWIDLIFGYKQRGQQAITNMNIFFPLTYEDSINLDTVQDKEQRISFETQIAHFGQNPSQIIGNNPHPIRMKVKASWQGRLFSDAGQGILIQRCNLDSKLKPSHLKQQKFLYKSIFESKNSIMSIKFLDDFHFIVVRKHQYFIFKILQKKSQFISKQQQISYELESTEISINYKQLNHYVSTATIEANLVVLGGFFNGYIHLLFVQEHKCNQTLKIQGLNTVTAIQYASSYQMLYLGDNEGYLKVYEINFSSTSKANSTNTKQIQFLQIKFIKIHDSKINSICLNQKANLAATCSTDGFVKVINLYSQQLIRIYRNPEFQFGGLQNSISFCQISISPLYSILFYSQKSRKIYSYSINGQYLSQISYSSQQKQKSSKEGISSKDYIYNLSVIPASDTTQRLTFLTSSKDLYILQVPFLEQKRKIKLKRDQYKISCFESCQNGRICLTGTQDGEIQIIADPACY